MYTSWKNHLVAISTAQPHTDSACSHQVVQEIERRLWPSQSGFHQVALVATYSCIWKWGSIHRQVMALLKDNHDTPLEFDTHMGVGQSWSTWHAGFGWVSGLYVSAAQKRVEYCWFQLKNSGNSELTLIGDVPTGWINNTNIFFLAPDREFTISFRT